MNTDPNDNGCPSFKATHEQFARMFALSEMNQDTATSLRARLWNILKNRSHGLKPNAFSAHKQLKNNNISGLTHPVKRQIAHRDIRFHCPM